MVINQGQTKLLASFFSNMAVLWFGGAIINYSNWFVVAKGVASGTLALFVALILLKEVRI